MAALRALQPVDWLLQRRGLLGLRHVWRSPLWSDRTDETQIAATRAWVAPTLMETTNQLALGQPFRASIKYTNTGRAPALHEREYKGAPKILPIEEIKKFPGEPIEQLANAITPSAAHPVAPKQPKR